MAKRLQIRRDSTANWTSNNPVLAEGEPAWDTTLEKGKIGDGSTAWSSLPFSIFTQTELDAKAPLSSPGLFGVPTAPTASVDTDTTQIATTAFVINQEYIKDSAASSIYLDRTSASANYASLTSPVFVGTPYAPTASVNTSNTQIATTAFVGNQITSQAIEKTIVNAKGDIIAATGSDAVTNVSVGSDGQVLTADSTAPAGVSWTTASAGSGVAISGSANQVVYKNSSNEATGSANFTFNGTDMSVNGSIKSTMSSGDEGGEIFLNKSVTNTTISDGVIIDVYQNKLRFFESGGSTRGYYLDLTSGGNGVSSSLSGLAPINSPTFTGTVTLPVNTILTKPAIISPLEKVTLSATAATGTVHIDINTQSVLYYTSNSSANWTLNVRGDGSTTLNNTISTGQSITLVFLATQGATAYYQTALNIDGVSQTVKWMSGLSPSAGNTNSIDAYSFTIIKTGTSTYTVLGQMTKFA